MKKLSYLLFFALFSLLLAGETTLGNISLGDTYDSVLEKYPQYAPWKKLEPVSPPYPAHIMDNSPLYLAQSKELDIICYFNQNKRVESVVVYLYERQDSAIYETSAGLRTGDGPLELNLLYGEPADISEYVYNDENNNKVIRRIYYYPDLCIHSSRQIGKKQQLPETLESIVLAKYDLKYVLKNKNEDQTQKKK